MACGCSSFALEVDAEKAEQAEGKTNTIPYDTHSRTSPSANQGCYPGEQQNCRQYKQETFEMITLPNVTIGSPSVLNQDHSTIKREETFPDEQTCLDKRDLTHEDVGNSAPEERGVEDTSKRFSIENLRKMDGVTRHWDKLALQLKDEMAKQIQDQVDWGLGCATVQKMYKDSDKITKRIGTVGSACEGNKSQEMKPKASSDTLPTITDVRKSLSEVFEKLKSDMNELMNELTNNVHEPQEQVSRLTAMTQLIEKGCTALRILECATDSISEELTALQKDLKFQDVTADMHFQKCTEVVPALVKSFLTEQNGNTRHSAKMASELNDEITKVFQDLESGSGRAKVQELYKVAVEMAERIGTLQSASKCNKSQKRQPKASTSPTIKEVGQSLSEVFEKLALHVNELTNNLHERQKQVSLSRLIEEGRNALRTLGLGTDWILGKLTMLQNDLKFRELTMDRNFRNFAEAVPDLAQAFLTVRKGHFISMASICDWYGEYICSRKEVKESFSVSSYL
ncbi:unnamed protein product [Calypogeia fissa]